MENRNPSYSHEAWMRGERRTAGRPGERLCGSFLGACPPGLPCISLHTTQDGACVHVGIDMRRGLRLASSGLCRLSYSQSSRRRCGVCSWREVFVVKQVMNMAPKKKELELPKKQYHLEVSFTPLLFSTLTLRRKMVK